jgi:hypothetical protein
MEDPLLVFDLIQLLALAGCHPYMLGDGAVILIYPAVSFGTPGAGAFCLQQSFLRSRACHKRQHSFSLGVFSTCSTVSLILT